MKNLIPQKKETQSGRAMRDRQTDRQTDRQRQRQKDRGKEGGKQRQMKINEASRKRKKSLKKLFFLQTQTKTTERKKNACTCHKHASNSYSMIMLSIHSFMLYNHGYLAAIEHYLKKNVCYCKQSILIISPLNLKY